MSFEPVRNRSDELALAQGCYFDESKGRRVCDFIEKFCRQSKGRWSKQALTLIDWQTDLLMRLFGWRRPDGKRRFRSLYCEIPKKNGKSTLVSGLAIELALADDEGAPEIYLNAVDRKQADIVFEEACRMVEASPSFSRRLDVSRYRGVISDPVGYGKIQKNSADAPSADGANASAVIFDEIHRFKSRALWDVFTYAGAAREQPLRIVITTAGEDAEGVWWEQREFSEKVNSGAIQNTTHLGVIYRARTAADPEGADDLDDPETWKRANPSLGHTISLDAFRAEYEEAKAKGGIELGNFLRLRLGIVVAAEGKFVDLRKWDACGDFIEPDPSDPCYMGLDLSDRRDLAALVLITGSVDDGFIVQCRFWLPREDIADLEARHGQPYRIWAEQGLIRLTPGNTIDYKFIEKEIVDLAMPRDLKALFSDPWNAKKLAEELLNDHGLPVEYIRQGYGSLSDPTKTLGGLIVSGKLRHGGHPILRWHASNAIARQDPAGNIKLDKELSRKKIDGMAALVNAVAAAIAHGGDAGHSVYEQRGIFVV